MKKKVLVCDVCEQEVADPESGVAIAMTFRQALSPERPAGRRGALPKGSEVAPSLSWDACPACTANMREQMSQQAHLEQV